MGKLTRVVFIICAVIGIPGVFANAQTMVMPGLYAGIGLYQEKQTFTGGNAATGTAGGLVLGGVLDIPLSSTVSLRPGLVFVSRGGTWMADAADSVTMALHYLTVPIDLELKYPAAPDINAYGLVGVNVGALISASGHITGANAGMGDIDYARNYRPFDAGIQIGAGAEFLGRDLTPFIEASYYIGLTNSATFVPADVYDYSQSNAGLELKAGVKFRPGALKRFLSTRLD